MRCVENAELEADKRRSHKEMFSQITIHNRKTRCRAIAPLQWCVIEVDSAELRLGSKPAAGPARRAKRVQIVGQKRKLTEVKAGCPKRIPAVQNAY